MMQQGLLAQLLECGVDKDEAIALLPQIELCLTLPAVDAWQTLTRDLLQPHHPFSLHLLLYELTFAEGDSQQWNSQQGSPPAWFPTREQIEATHIAALMRQLNFRSYPELHAWSVQNRAAFWSLIIERLGIRFRQPYTQLVDLSHGIESPDWLVDARLNIVESCFQAAEDAPAILAQSENQPLNRWTYGELKALANRVANGLIDLGMQPGDAVAIDLPMTAEAVAIYLGIIQVGGVVVSIADSFAAAEIATRLRIAKAKLVFTQDYIQRCGKLLPLYAKVIEAAAPPAIVLSRDSSKPTASVRLRPGDFPWPDFLSSNERFDPIPAQPAAHTNILFSSGTTGDPKAIPWSHTTPIKCATDAHLHHDIHPGDILAWSTNLGWMMGPWLIYASLINRATLAIYDGAPTTREYGEFIQNAGVTMLGVVPSLVSAWKASHCMHGLDWSAIRAFSSTGECSNPQDMLFLMALANYKPIIEYCGGTEIGGGYITSTLVQPCAPASFTTPALGLDFIILDADHYPANKGEAFIIPPSIGLSTELLNQDHHRVYFGEVRRQETEANLKLSRSPSPPTPTPLRRHGDYIERFPNGYYRVCGRVDDTMNLGGIKVSSAEIEQVVSRVSGIQEAAAIAFSPPNGGPSQLIIYATLAPQTQQTQTELKAAMQTAIAHQLNPLFKIHDLVILDALPRTASNKIMRRVLRECYG
ncbi:AMP-binding protein [Leptolyngbya sp. NK1-12]|uniref:AMP-binding protein n=2 Tax=Leptolyngbya sp. NK1-12 TaxID=2547451 RepID=A0AA97AT09_9CYAN|nr:AMP-binding protein [Leptolyngbya sp. NK1-12]